MKKIKLESFRKLIIFLLIFVFGASAGYYYFSAISPKSVVSIPQQSKYVLFLSEIYDKIKINYWDSINDNQLIDLFILSSNKFLGPGASQSTTQAQLFKSIGDQLKSKSDVEAKTAVVNMAQAVLASLNPVGRSGLYTQQLEQQLKNTVNNVNPQKDLYKDLGLPKSASSEAVTVAYQKQATELSKQNTPEAKDKLKQLTYNKNVLTDAKQKQVYDQNGAEPTIFTTLLSPDIAYIEFKKFSPTSFDEFQRAFLALDVATGPSSVILDLRGNIGGAIDATPFFAGLFIGNNQYAYDFYHKGEYKPFKTVTNKLPVIDKLREIIVLTDNQTQSSAELLASVLKKYNKALLVGVPTKGWGTVESLYPLDNQIDQGEKYSVFLVHDITIRDDNQPIEGRGVDPNINITDPSWQTKLAAYLRYPQLVDSVKSILQSPPTN